MHRHDSRDRERDQRDSQMKALLLKAVISVLLIVSVLHFNRIEGVTDRMLTADLLALGFAVCIAIATSFVHAARWMIVIKAVGNVISYTRATRIVLIGYFFNHFLPTSLGGDVFRIWHTYRDGVGLASAANSVILDRVIALLALLLMMTASLPWLFTLIQDASMKWAIAAAIIGGLCGIALLIACDYLPTAFRRWKVFSMIMRLSTDSRAVFLQQRYNLPAIALSVFMHAIYAMLVFIIASSIHLKIGIIDCLLLVPPVILIIMLPFSIAGWGLREGAMVVAFGFVNVAPSDAFALSVLTGIIVMVASLPGALLWLLTDNLSKEPRFSVKDGPPNH